MNYKIVRFFQREDQPNQTIVRGLTLEQAQAHCNDPETSSKTATSPEAIERTERCGAWFDGYKDEGSGRKESPLELLAQICYLERLERKER